MAAGALAAAKAKFKASRLRFSSTKLNRRSAVAVARDAEATSAPMNVTNRTGFRHRVRGSSLVNEARRAGRTRFHEKRDGEEG